MPVDESGWSWAQILDCCIRVRNAPTEAGSLAEVATTIVRELRGAFPTGSDQSAFVLARLFTAERLEDLPERLQQLAANRSAEPLAPGTRCLTLLGTDGDLVEWQSPATSRAHQVIPLPSRDSLSRAPTVAALVRELGMDAAALLDEVDAADFDRVGTHSDVFYVADAPGVERLIPDQDLVAEHGVRSVVGFGGLLPAGRMFAVVLFSRMAITAEAADMFRTVAMSVKLALLPFCSSPVFGGGDTTAPEPAAAMPARIAALEDLVVELELTARQQSLQAGTALLDLRAAVAAESAVSKRLTALMDVSLALSRATSIQQLAAIIIERGLAALGADGGAVAVKTPQGNLQVAPSDSLGERLRRDYTTMQLDSPLPASVAAATGRTVLLHNAEESLAWSPEMALVLPETNCQAWAALPLRAEGGVLGSLVAGWTEPQEFGPAEREMLDALAAQCAYGLEGIQSRLAERRAAVEARRMSETLQRSLLTDPPRFDALELAVRYRPAVHEAQVGGDWYDAYTTSDGAPELVIGDVAGHDRDAAAAMGQLRNLLRGMGYTLGEPPAAVLSALDRRIRDLRVDALATAVLVRVEPAPAGNGWLTLRWSNAGHPPPLLIRADGSTRLLDAEADLLLGLDPATPRHDYDIVLEQGETVLLYTDGLVERRGADLDEGLSWLRSSAGRLAGLSLDEVCDALLEDVERDAEDDIALLAVRPRLPAPA